MFFVNNFLDLKNSRHYTQKHLQGWVKFPTGGKVRESKRFDLVQFQNRQLQSGWKKMNR